MSVLAEIIDTLENKIEKLFFKINTLEKSNQDLKIEISNAVKTIEIQSKQMDELKSKYETLKMTNGLLGSDENKRETKLKINSLLF